MNGRERLSAVLRRQPKDRMPWTVLADDATLSRLPERMKGFSYLDFCRHLGCDVFMLGGWGTKHGVTSPQLRWSPQVRTVRERGEGQTVVNWETPRGVLTAIRHHSGHPVKYPVDSIEDVRIYREMWEGASFVAAPSEDCAALARINEELGDLGVATQFWGPSAIPRLLEEDIGTERFYYLMADHPEEMDGLIKTMHARYLGAFRLLADGPWESITLCENTSTFYISPDIYKRYNMPHQRAFVELARARGKVAILHMCGHIHNLLDLIKETGCDGIHTLTPPPTGDTLWEEALDVLGEDLVILGCLDPSVWISGPIRDIPATLDKLITPRLRAANFILNPMADGVPVELERFEAIAGWMRRG